MDVERVNEYGGFRLGNDQYLGNQSGNKTSLNYNEDEGIFTWNGKNYSSIRALNDALNAANLTSNEEDINKRKLSLFGFDA